MYTKHEYQTWPTYLKLINCQTTLQGCSLLNTAGALS